MTKENFYKPDAFHNAHITLSEHWSQMVSYTIISLKELFTTAAAMWVHWACEATAPQERCCCKDHAALLIQCLTKPINQPTTSKLPSYFINGYMRNRYTKINKSRPALSEMNNNVCRVCSCRHYSLCPELGLIDIAKKFEWDRCINNDCCMDATQYLSENTEKKIHFLYVASIWFRWWFGSVVMRWSRWSNRWSNSKLGLFNTGIFGQKTISVCKLSPRSSACEPGHPFVGRQAQLEYQQKPGHKEAHHALH